MTMLERAYAAGHPLESDGTLYVPGTGADIVHDLIDDALLAAGLKPGHRSGEAESALSGVHTLVGHSLGGTVAHQVALEHGLRSRAYNPGSSPLTVLKGTKKNRIIRHGLDLVSSSTFGAEEEPLASMAPLYRHGISSFGGA